MAQFIIEVKGLKELQAKFESLEGKKFKDQMKRTMYVATSKIKTTARELVPVDRGILRRSIRDEVRYGIRGLKGIIEAGEQYASSVEYGTKPHFPPVSALSSWARKRGINPYALAVAISKRGTKPHPFMKPAFEEWKEKIVGFFKETIDFLLSK